MELIIKNLKADEQITKRLVQFLDANSIEWQQQPALPQADVGSSAAIYHNCVDCDKSDETVKKRSAGYGYQCLDCYNDDMEFEADYR